jgi:flagellar basal body-associated protein FliL
LLDFVDYASVVWINKAYLKKPQYQRKLGAPLKNSKGKRNKAVIALLLPVIIFLWIVGWSLYWIGRQKESRKPQPDSSEEEEYVSLEAITLEESLETERCEY